VNLVLIGENESVVKSINKNIGIESIDPRDDNPKKKALSLKIDSQVTDYQWYLSNIIKTLSDGNVSVKDTPLKPVENVPDAKGYNFATGTCTMYQKGITGDANTADPNAMIKKGGSDGVTNPATMIFDNNDNNHNFVPGNQVTLVNGNPDGHNNGVIIEINNDGTYEVEMQYPNDEGVVTLQHDEIRLNNTGGRKKRKYKSRKRGRRKRTRKNKRKHRKSRSSRLPKLTRRTPYKKYS
jgi:hypothetical protein